MKYAIVNRAVGVLKSEPKEASKNVDEVLFGMNVEILNEEGQNWFYVRTHYDYEGYINRKNLIIDDEMSNKWKKDKNIVVINAFADVLNIPEASAYEISRLTRGASLISTDEISKDKKFLKVKLPCGENGWIRRSFTEKLKSDYEIQNEEKLRLSLEKSALSYIGTQYRWGGKSPLGIDCSGLCSMAYMLNGILIYRDADIKKGFPIKEIPFSNIKKGDLIFFPGHVAMYLEEGNYIHSSTSNDVVKINSLNENSENYNEYLGNYRKRFGSIF
jgi:hypothetical protein